NGATRENISTKLQEITEEQLDENLRHFYAEARTATGQEYSKISLLSFRNAFERFLNENGQSVKLSKNPKFHKSNKMLDSKLKSQSERRKRSWNYSQTSYYEGRPAEVEEIPSNVTKQPINAPERSLVLCCFTTGAAEDAKGSESSPEEVFPSPPMPVEQ
ncbi:BTB/POZ domain-containing protein kctd1, partial [Desmophyllum pertusum]